MILFASLMILPFDSIKILIRSVAINWIRAPLMVIEWVLSLPHL